jgi:hypothetical protein
MVCTFINGVRRAENPPRKMREKNVRNCILTVLSSLNSGASIVVLFIVLAGKYKELLSDLSFYLEFKAFIHSLFFRVSSLSCELPVSQTPVSSIIFRDRGRFFKQLMIVRFFYISLYF